MHGGEEGAWAFGSLPASMELVQLCVSVADIGGDRSSAVSQAVVASGRNSPSNLLQLQPRNQKVCSSQGRLHPGWSRKGQGEGGWLPCRGVGAAGMGKGWGVEPGCSRERCSVFQPCFALCSFIRGRVCAGCGYLHEMLCLQSRKRSADLYVSLKNSHV